MDPSSRLGLGHPLDPVNATLELQAGKSACPLNRKGYFLYASKLCLTGRVHLTVPSLALGIHGVHPIEGVGKEGGLLSAYPGPYFHNNVFVIVGILWEEQYLQLPFQLWDVLHRLRIFLLGQFLHLRIRHQFSSLVPGL